MRDREKPLLTQNLINENASKAAAISASLAAIAEEIAAAKEACAATLLSRRNQVPPTRPGGHRKETDSLPRKTPTEVRQPASTGSLRPPPPPPLPISIVPEYDTTATPDDEEGGESPMPSDAEKTSAANRRSPPQAGYCAADTTAVSSKRGGNAGNRAAGTTEAFPRGSLVSGSNNNSSSGVSAARAVEKVSIKKGTKKQTGVKVVAPKKSQDTATTLVTGSQKTDHTGHQQAELLKKEVSLLSTDHTTGSEPANLSESSAGRGGGGGGGGAAADSGTLSTAGMEPAMIVATALANPSFIPAAIAHFTVEMYKASAAGDASTYAVLYAAYCQLCTYASASAVLGAGGVAAAPGSQKPPNMPTEGNPLPGLVIPSGQLGNPPNRHAPRDIADRHADV